MPVGGTGTIKYPRCPIQAVFPPHVEFSRDTGFRSSVLGELLRFGVWSIQVFLVSQLILHSGPSEHVKLKKRTLKDMNEAWVRMQHSLELESILLARDYARVLVTNRISVTFPLGCSSVA